MIVQTWYEYHGFRVIPLFLFPLETFSKLTRSTTILRVYEVPQYSRVRRMVDSRQSTVETM